MQSFFLSVSLPHSLFLWLVLLIRTGCMSCHTVLRTLPLYLPLSLSPSLFSVPALCFLSTFAFLSYISLLLSFFALAVSFNNCLFWYLFLTWDGWDVRATMQIHWSTSFRLIYLLYIYPIRDQAVPTVLHICGFCIDMAKDVFILCVSMNVV